MKVLHVIEGLAPSLGGLSRAVAKLSEEMARSGAEVEIVTTTRPHSVELFSPVGVNVHAVPCKFIRAWAYAPSLSRTIKNSVKNADLIHLHGLWLFPHFVASRASWRAGKPYVVSPHGMVDRWALSQGRLKKQIYGNLVEWQTLRRAAALHAVSESEAEDIKRLGFTSKIVTIPNGVDLAEFAQLPGRSVFRERYPSIADKTVFLFLGRIHQKKGLDLLVSAFCQLAKSNPNTVLMIAGPDETGYQKQLENYLAAAGQLDNCIFTGMLRPEERLEALAAADIFVLPSYSEGFPIAPIEALAAGLPVILTEACNVPGIEESGCGIIVNPETASLSAAMLQLANNQELGKQMGARGRELVFANYTWDRIAKRMTEVYENVLQAKRTGIRAERSVQEIVENDLTVNASSANGYSPRTAPPLRILKVTQTYYPYLNNGGPPAKVSGIAKTFVRRGHEVTVLTADRGADNNAAIHPEWKRKKIDLGWESLRDGVQTIYLPTIVSYRTATFNPQILKFCDQLLTGYDVVHVYGLYDLLGCVVARACVRRGTPYVLEPLGMFGPKIRSKRKKRLYRWLIGTQLFRGAKVVIANSENEREELIRGGIAREKIVLRRNGLELAQFESLPRRGAFREKLGIGDEVPVVLFLGRLSFIKGLDVLVRAFANVGREAKLIIAGPDDQDGCARSIRKLIHKLGLEQRIILTGPLYEKEKLQAFVDADVFVLPSRYESFGNAAAESVACGTPVLVTDTCGIAPFIESRVGIVTPCDSEQIARGINLLLHDRDLLGRLARNCAAVARDLSWDEPVEAMERLYTLLTKQEVTLPVNGIAFPQGAATEFKQTQAASTLK